MRYFVWRFDDTQPYRAYGIRNHVMPDANDEGCIWRGDSLVYGVEIAVSANKAERRRKTESLKRQMDLLKDH